MELVWVSPPSTVTNAQTFTLDLKIPANERIPIGETEVILEQQASGKTGTALAGKQSAGLVARARCPFSSTVDSDCPNSFAFTAKSGDAQAAITKVKFLGFSTASRSSLTDGYFGEGTLQGTGSGYGYDDLNPVGLGYGYGYFINDYALRSGGTGYGYGYDGDETLNLRFEVTIDAGQLTDQTIYFITMLAHTGSATLGVFSSPFSGFTASHGGGGGGGGGGGAGTTYTAVAAAVPAGALRAWQVTGVTQPAGVTITINTGDVNYPRLVFKLGEALNGATILLVIWPSQTFPTGTQAAPAGYTVIHYLQITITPSTPLKHEVTVSTSFDEKDVPSPTKGAFLHLVSSAYQPESRIPWTLKGGLYTGDATSPCCSTFAVGMDTTNPTVTLTVPTGTLTGTVSLKADAADNVKVSRVKFLVDDKEVGSDDSAPYEYSLDTRTLANGAHTVKAVATDFVGNEASDSESVTVQNVSPTATTTTKAPGPLGKAGSILLWIIVGLVVVGAIIALVVAAGKKKGKK